MANTQYGLSNVPTIIKVLLRDNAWRERVIEQTGEMPTFARFEDFVGAPPLAGLGADIKTLQRLCADDREALDMIDQAVQNPVGSNQHVDNINTYDRPTGTSKEHALRKLRKDAPELHGRVLAGELSPHAAMVTAGFRKRTLTVPLEPDGLARAIRRHLSDDEIERLIELLEND